MHNKYKDRIPDELLLFTWAAVFVESKEWIKRFEWRVFTPLEEFAHFVFWREIGNRMGINPSIVPPNPKELEIWYRKFELDNMVYNKSNELAGQGTVAIMLSSISGGETVSTEGFGLASMETGEQVGHKVDEDRGMERITMHEVSRLANDARIQC